MPDGMAYGARAPKARQGRWMGIYLDQSVPNVRQPSAESGKDDLLTDGAPLSPMPPAESGSRGGISGRSDLIQIIEGEIIPRLFLAHRDRQPHRLAGATDDAGELGDRIFLTGLFLTGDTQDIVGRLQSLLANGMRRERVYLDILAPVPQSLSQVWAEGRCSFDEMAIGLCCVDDVLRELHEREHGSEG